MGASTSIGEAFRRLQAGDAAGALAFARGVAAEQPGNARAHLASGIALRLLGRLDEALAELALAASLDPQDHACAYEAGVVHQLRGEGEAALERFARCAALRPGFFAAQFSAGLLRMERREWELAAACFREVLAAQPGQPEAMLQLAGALERAGRHADAEAAYVNALAANPHHAPTLRVFGQYSASRGNMGRAASLFAEAARLEPGDSSLPMYVAQAELLLGRFAPAWAAYARREPRIRHEHDAARRGEPYRVPRPDELAGKAFTLVGEQGLGDTLFFLRWAPRLASRGARLAFAGEARLHSLLARTGLFTEGLHADAIGGRRPILVGDLPAILDGESLAVPSLAISPLPERMARWRETLEAAGPRPWIGAMWRAGTPRDARAHALSKSVPVEMLFTALSKSAGTVVSLQRDPLAAELEAASHACGRPVADIGAGAAALEDLLALMPLLDRHVTVSNTNVHLAAAVGATADVLVPFPPEWRWRLEGDSPWFPGFRVLRQDRDGDWSQALAGLAQVSGRQ